MLRYATAWGAIELLNLLNASLDYSLDRKQFGEPFAAKQLVLKLADMQTEITRLQSV